MISFIAIYSMKIIELSGIANRAKTMFLFGNEQLIILALGESQLP